MYLGLFLEADLVILWAQGTWKRAVLSCVTCSDQGVTSNERHPWLGFWCWGFFFLILKLITLVSVEISQALLQALKYVSFVHRWVVVMQVQVLCLEIVYISYVHFRKKLKIALSFPCDPVEIMASCQFAKKVLHLLHSRFQDWKSRGRWIEEINSLSAWQDLLHVCQL